MANEKILATVGGVNITEADIDAFIEGLSKEQKAYASIPQFRQQCLEQLISLQLYAMMAEEEKLDETEEFEKMMAGARKEILANLAMKKSFENLAVTEEECKALVSELENIPSKIEETFGIESDCQYAASTLVNAESLLYIGRGLDYALSMEGSLKLKEISYIHSESYAAGELKHGTISLVTEDMPVIAVATQDRLFDKTVSNIKEVKARGAKVVMVTKNTVDVTSDVADVVVKLPVVRDVLMPMITVVPLQLIAYYTSVLKGCDVDKPRNLAKSVTVE